MLFKLRSTALRHRRSNLRKYKLLGNERHWRDKLCCLRFATWSTIVRMYPDKCQIHQEIITTLDGSDSDSLPLSKSSVNKDFSFQPKLGDRKSSRKLTGAGKGRL